MTRPLATTLAALAGVAPPDPERPTRPDVTAALAAAAAAGATQPEAQACLWAAGWHGRRGNERIQRSGLRWADHRLPRLCAYLGVRAHDWLLPIGDLAEAWLAAAVPGAPVAAGSGWWRWAADSTGPLRPAALVCATLDGGQHESPALWVPACATSIQEPRRRRRAPTPLHTYLLRHAACRLLMEMTR